MVACPQLIQISSSIFNVSPRFVAMEGPQCGILALNGPAHDVHTRGLKWNLSGDTISLGAFVSTSNVITGLECAPRGGDFPGSSTSCDGVDARGNKRFDNESESESGREDRHASKCGGGGGGGCDKARVEVSSSGGGCLLWVCSLRLSGGVAER